MPYRNPTNKMLLLVFYSGIAFWFLPLAFSGIDLQAAFNSVVFGISTVILVTWGASAYYSLRGNADAEHQHIISTVAVWFIVWCRGLYSIIFVSLDRPTWMVLSAFPAFITYMFGMTGILVVMAPAFVDDVNLRDYYFKLAIGSVLGVLLSGLSYYMQIG